MNSLNGVRSLSVRRKSYFQVAMRYLRTRGSEMGSFTFDIASLWHSIWLIQTVLTYTFRRDEFHLFVGQLSPLYPAQCQKPSFQMPTLEQKEI